MNPKPPKIGGKKRPMFKVRHRTLADLLEPKLVPKKPMKSKKPLK